jgi:hypothetical protein
MSTPFLIGWGEADITPDGRTVALAGQYYLRIAKGIHSRIKTVALALQKGDQQAVMVELDVVNIGSTQELVRPLIHAAIPEIREESIFLNAIHTHSAPGTVKGTINSQWEKAPEGTLTPDEFLDFLCPRIVDAVRQAWEGRRPGGIAPAFGTARIGHCRRAVFSDGVAEMYGDTTRRDFIGMEAGEDSGVEMLFTFDLDQKPTGMIVNVACPSQVMEATYKISSDYMGAARELLKGEFGPDFHTLCQISAAGCQSPRDLTRNFKTEPDFWHEDGVPVHANRVLKAVQEAFPQTARRIDYDPVFKHECAPCTLPMRRVSYQQYVAAKKELARLLAIQDEQSAFDDFARVTHEHEQIPGRPGPYDDKLMHFVLIKNEQAVVKRYETQDARPTYTYPMQTLRIGDCAMVNCPWELYLVFGQIIKARTKAHQTFIVQLSGGTAAGYLPSPEAERFAGYGGMIINGTVGADGGYLLADTAVERLNALFE